MARALRRGRGGRWHGRWHDGIVGGMTAPKAGGGARVVEGAIGDDALTVEEDRARALGFDDATGLWTGVTATGALSVGGRGGE